MGKLMMKRTRMTKKMKKNKNKNWRKRKRRSWKLKRPLGREGLSCPPSRQCRLAGHCCVRGRASVTRERQARRDGALLILHNSRSVGEVRVAGRGAEGEARGDCLSLPRSSSLPNFLICPQGKSRHFFYQRIFHWFIDFIIFLIVVP